MSSLIGGFAIPAGRIYKDSPRHARLVLFFGLARLLRWVGDQRLVLGDGLSVTVQVVDLGILRDFHRRGAGNPVVRNLAVAVGEVLLMGASRLRGCCSGCLSRLSLACTVGNLFLRSASAQTLDDDLARRALEGKFAVCVQVSRLFSQVEAVDNASAAEILIALDAVSPREGERLLNLLGGYLWRS